MEATFSFAELKNANDTAYAEVEAYGRKVAIGSLNSEDMIEWLESNDDPAQKKEAGLRLIVKSVIEVTKRSDEGKILEGNRIPKEDRDSFLVVFRTKDARNNGRVVKAILELNGLNTAARKLELVKNESSEVSPVASPIDSPSQPVA